MHEGPSVLICRYCGAPRQRYLGECRVCKEQVCAFCGNLQDTVESGRVAIHNMCLKNQPEMASEAFKFIKFTK